MVIRHGILEEVEIYPSIFHILLSGVVETFIGNLQKVGNALEKLHNTDGQTATYRHKSH